MRNLLSLAIMLSLPAVAAADDSRCLVSFSGAQLDVCENRVTATAPAMDSLLDLAMVQDSTLRLIKFDGPITAKQRWAVEATGARILGYAPYNSYIVRMPSERDAMVKTIDGVVWTGAMAPALKVDANIFAQVRQGGIVEGLEIDSLNIQLDTDVEQVAVRNALSTIQGLSDVRIHDVGGELYALAKFQRGANSNEQLAATVADLALRDDVLAVEFRMPARTHNSQGQWLHQSGVNNARSIWDKGVYGCGQIVGVLDTGLHQDNAAFSDPTQITPVDKCSTGTSCTSVTPNMDARKVVSYYKWSGLSGTSWADPHGHGTHVAGSVLGNDAISNPGVDCTNFTTAGGTTDLDGMATGAKLVMQETGGNLAYLNSHGGNPYHAGKIAYENGARIHNNSWGSGCTDNNTGLCISSCSMTYRSTSRESDRVMRDHDDLLMVFAAGNDGTQCANGNNMGAPGNAKNVLSIGATQRGTSGNNMANFSSRGPSNDARTKPDVVTQGANIRSAARNATGTTSMSGTSMASPTAAGLAALVRDYLASGFYPSGQAIPGDAITSPSGALVKAIMVAGAFRMTSASAGANPGQAQGFGRVLLEDSLYFSGDESLLFIHDEKLGLQTSDTHTHPMTVVGDERLTFVLTWTDEAAAVGANPATVNSLRLEVTAPNGDVWTQKLPSGHNVNNANPIQDISTSNYDNLNNLHRIQFDTPATGVYLVRVTGINVPMGPQPYALAATGNFDIEGVDLYKVGGQIAGLLGSGMQLRLNGGNQYSATGNGAFEFSGGLPDAMAYSVTVGQQPLDPAQECTVTNGVGTIAGADVNNVQVDCVTLPTYSVSGNVSGLTGSGFTLRLNNDEQISVTADGGFDFDSELVTGNNYFVTVGTQPAGQNCSVANGSGVIAGADVTNVEVNCADLPPEARPIGGRVSGLTAAGLILQLNGGVTLTRNFNGIYAFHPGVADGQQYEVTVHTQPAGVHCVVSNATGTVAFVPVTDVDVECSVRGNEIFEDGFEPSA